MTSMQGSSADAATKWVRWMARGIGSLAGAFWLLSLIASLIVELIEGHGPWSPEGAMLMGLVIFVALGVLIAWRREGIGGLVAVIGAIALCIFAYVTAGHNKGFAMLISGGPFLVAGILFLACWRRSERQGR